MQMKFDVGVYCLIVLHFDESIAPIKLSLIAFNDRAINVIIIIFWLEFKAIASLLIPPKGTAKLFFLLSSIHPTSKVLNEFIAEKVIQFIMD